MHFSSCIYFLVLIHVFALMVQGQVQAASKRFAILQPVAYSPYVAGQIVPVTYTIPDDAALPSILGLAVFFTSRDTSVPFFHATISNNADLTQGFSFRRTANTEVYYEHQLNYNIPKETPAGNYQIVFMDTIGGSGNTTVPIIVRPYSTSSGSSSTATNKPAQVSNIFLQDNSASSFSKVPLFVIWASFAFIFGFFHHITLH
ncbi:hypothetical protein BCR42DRAFT_451672 [Absidia repens]|uniref:Ser-Thr-rich glycosyl-phosphatidyl-inositol-anchored membrane family-domain-containing protein n=1 Tax=Absidia repens TaxID=90262 RepID=A0A1X2IFP5_9FUNG|nr:hypothetical protein BCR42DRAFT_451672 [Absidia repens]